MPRKPRVDYPGAWHHVMHRGARRQAIFKKDEQCILFLGLLDELANEFELEIHAYSLMPNHYHLLVRSRHGNLSRAMRHLNANYTQRINDKERWDGPLFRGRFRSQLVEDETNLPYLLAYIHLNPLKAGLITRLQSHAWTSHRAYLGRDPKPPWLVMEYFNSVFDDANALHRYVLDLHRTKTTWPEQMAMDSGWLRLKGERAERRLPSVVESRFMAAQDVLERVSIVTGKRLEELQDVAHGPRANPARRYAVWALKQHTQLNQQEIGDELDMSASQVSHVLRRLRKKDEPFRAWIDQW